VAILRADQGTWWRSDGTWGARQWLKTTLTRPRGDAVDWTFTWPRGRRGRFVLYARARDAHDVVDPTPATASFVVSKAASSAFLSILFGRTQWVSSSGCTPLQGTVDLGTVAATMAQRGLMGVGTVVVDRTGEASPVCLPQSLSATWGQIAALRDAYGWGFVSAGESYRDMTQLSPSDQWAESCGSLDAFSTHDVTDAWGLFAYPNNRWDEAVQSSVVSTCFAFGRTYQSGLDRIGTAAPPWFQHTVSVNGGACNDASAWCYDPAAVGTTYRYTSPDQLVTEISPAPGDWRSVQFYRFVTGSRTGTPSWDCTSADWQDHWSSQSELYCYDDFLSVLDRLPPGITVTDPATVAVAWGRGDPGVDPG
jgi:hypothetical protein